MSNSEWSNTKIAIGAFGVVLGGGAFYALIKYLQNSQPYNSRGLGRGKGQDGKHDLNLPLVLEQHYGNVRAVILDDNPVTARYLQEFPDQFFNFHENLLAFTTEFVTQHTDRFRQALVVGSGPGYLVFQLANLFDEVKGIEKSFSQVVICYQFQNLIKVHYNFPVEGALKSIPRSVESPLASGSTAKTAAEKRRKKRQTIEFVNYDISTENKFPPYIGEFQLVVLRNSLEDLDDPFAFLASLKNTVHIGGFLIISSDYLWKKSFIVPANFPASKTANSFAIISFALKDSFKLTNQKEMPELICECARTCRIRMNDVTAWLRVPPSPTPTSSPKTKKPSASKITKV